MLHAALTLHPAATTADRLLPHTKLLLAAALASAAAALTVPWPMAVTPLLGVAGGLGMLAVLAMTLSWRQQRSRRALLRQTARFVGRDESPGFLTDLEGVVSYHNVAATDRFGQRRGAALADVLGDYIASPRSLLTRLQLRARAVGSAREPVTMRWGQVRLSAHFIRPDAVLWRIEDIAERTGPGRSGDGISLPMLTVSNSGTVLYTNEALRRLVGGREASLDRIISDLPVRSGGIHRVAALEGEVEAVVHAIDSAGGRRELFLLPAPEDAADRPAAALPQSADDGPLFDALPVAMLRLSADGALRGANRLARDLLDHPAPPGTPLSDLVEGLGRPLSDWLADAAAGRGLNRAETLRARAPAQDVFLQISLGRVEQEGEVALIAVLNDATELKTLEAQFVQSQKMQAIGQLAGGVAHDFNNLLTAITGHCDLMLRHRDEGDPDFADLNQIAQNANRAADLVGQLLAFSRKQTLQPELLDLRETLSDHTHLLNRLLGETVRLTLSHDPALSPIRADKRKFEQVIMNLVVNARDAMPEGGEIVIETRMEHLREPFHRDRAEVPAGSYVVVRVCDQGTGIAPENLPKIFEPFYTTKKTGEGTGLGLSTAYGIVKQSGGFIFADSELGAGTRFSLYFPAHDEPVAALPEPAEPAAPRPPAAEPCGDGVVLLVEDEAPVRAFASRALRMRGYTVLEAENAEEALKTLEDRDLAVDLFVTDVIMPGMDGPSWVREALKQRPDTRVVFVSGYAKEGLAESQARIPNSVFLPKPFSLTELTETVQAQLH